MSRTVTTFTTTTVLEEGDRVRYIDFPKDRRGVSRCDRWRQRVVPIGVVKAPPPSGPFDEWEGAERPEVEGDSVRNVED